MGSLGPLSSRHRPHPCANVSPLAGVPAPQVLVGPVIGEGDVTLGDRQDQVAVGASPGWLLRNLDSSSSPATVCVA